MLTAAVGMVAMALPSLPATSQAAVPAVEGPAHRAAGDGGLVTGTAATPSTAHDTANGGPVTPAHLTSYVTDRPVAVDARRAASGVAVLMWAAVTAGLMAMCSGRNHRWRRARRRPISDDELRQLVGFPPVARPAI